MSDLDKISNTELVVATSASAAVGIIRLLSAIRKGRRLKVVDVLFEPLVAVFAGLCAWGMTEVTNVPDILQTVMTSVGAWAGPRLINTLERKYFGTSKADEGPKS